MVHRIMRSRLTGILLTLAVLLVAAVPAMAESHGSHTMGVDVGRESETVAFDSMFPYVMYVYEGDTINFINKAKMVPHTVTFLGGTQPDPKTMNPMVATQASGGSWDGKSYLNSGQMAPGAEYKVTFTKAGVYDYFCILHPFMTGQIVVLPQGAPIPSMEAQQKAADDQHKAHMIQAETLDKALSSGLPQAKANADGSLNWTVIAGHGHNPFSLNQFYPKHLVVSEGDTVSFPNQGSYEFHFVTFPTSPADAGKFFGEHGPNIEALMVPVGGTSVDGSQMVHSGGILSGQTATFSFPKAGTYSYICYIHGHNHMEGTITVLPKGAVKAYLNGKPLEYGKSRPAHIHPTHIFVPVRAFFEALGGSLAWDQETRTVTASTKGKAEAMKGEGAGIKLIVNGKQVIYTYEPAPHIHEDHVYVPAQELINAVGGVFKYDAATNTLMMEVR